MCIRDSVRSIHQVGVEHLEKNKIHIIGLDEVRPSVEVSEFLGTDLVFCLRRLLIYDGKPWSNKVSFLRRDPLPGFYEYGSELFDLYPFLEKKYHLFFETGNEYISASSANALDSHLLLSLIHILI